MEDASAIRYWCHMCSRSVNPVIEGVIIKCNSCQSGFVEEVDDAPDPPVTTNDHHHHHHDHPILLGMNNDHDHHTRNHRDEDDDGDDVDDQNNDGEFDFERQLEEIIRRRRRHSAAILDLLQGIRAGLSVESESNEDSEPVVLIDSFNESIRIQDSVETTSGSLGEYFVGPRFQMLLQRLNEIGPYNRYGTPPATKEAVEALDTVKIEESLLPCTVCLDDFEIGTEAKEMPCKHKFHSDCLLPWLELRSSCPLCRYVLPTPDEDGESKTDAETSMMNDDNNDDISIAFMENNGSSVDSSSNNLSVN